MNDPLKQKDSDKRFAFQERQFPHFGRPREPLMADIHASALNQVSELSRTFAKLDDSHVCKLTVSLVEVGEGCKACLNAVRRLGSKKRRLFTLHLTVGDAVMLSEARAIDRTRPCR